MRDLIILLFIIGSLPVILIRPWIGMLMWYWIGLMNPHRLAWGVARGFPVSMSVGLVLLTAVIFDRTKKSIPATPVTLLLFVVFAHFTLTSTVAMAGSLAWDEWFRVFKIILVTFVVPMLIYSRYRITWLMGVTLFSVGFYGIKGGVFAIVTAGQYRVWGPEGTFLESNTELAMALMMILPLYFCFTEQLKADEKMKKWFLYGAAGLTLLAILFTYSRGALIGLAALVGYMLLASNRRFLLAAMAVVLIVAGIAYAPDRFIERASTIQTYKEDNSAMQRIQAWGVAFNIAKERPLTGGGFRLAYIDDDIWLSYASFLGEWNNIARAAHSLYFQVLGQHGFLGLFLYMALLLATYRTLSKTARTFKKDSEHYWISSFAKGLRYGMFAFAATGAFLSVAYFDLAFLFIILSVVLDRERRELDLVQQEQNKVKRRGFVTTQGAPVFTKISTDPQSG
ncbi:MAG TPA: putative O-glycosylation ligase, exosortase A system-associated [Gammaproteobacteria bacterium]|nr:putative O-glycosylation ligase, exosortase A system-associated [Gammaproteobacteria bacterium]